MWVIHSLRDIQILQLLFKQKKDSGIGAILLINRRLAQPLGSIPRDWSSLRSTRLIHVARVESPSIFACSSSCCLNSSVNLIWYWGDRFSFCIDMVITQRYCKLHGNDHFNSDYQIKQRPVVLATHTGRLTNNRYME